VESAVSTGAPESMRRAWASPPGPQRALLTSYAYLVPSGWLLPIQTQGLGSPEHYSVEMHARQQYNNRPAALPAAARTRNGASAAREVGAVCRRWGLAEEEEEMEEDGEEEEEEEDGRAATVGVGTARAAHIAAMVLHSRAGVVRRGRGTGAAAPVGAQCYGTSSRFEPKSRLRIKSIFQPITALLDTDMYADTGILYGYLHRSGALCRYARPASAISRSSRRRPRQWNTWTLTASPQDRRGPPLRRTAVLSRPPPKHICYVRFKGVATTAE
jgi:hypothetical protein